MSSLNKQQGIGLIKFIALIPSVLIGLVILAFIFTLLNKAYWDYRVRQMCEKDGGVTVYEKVELTREEYKRYGGIKGVITVPGENSSIANQYRFLAKRSDQVIHSSNPGVTRYESVVYRRDDKRELGKMVLYARGGGDFPTIIGHPTGFSCFDIPDFKSNVEQQIFSVKEN